MGERKLQHVVPRFLLKRFAAESRGETSRLWRFSKSTNPALVSTRHAAAEVHFYGKEAEGLEAALGKAEGGWGALVRKIDDGKPLDSLADELWRFAYALAVRAGAMRNAFETATTEFFTHLEGVADSSEVRDGFQRMLPAELDRLMTEYASKVPPQYRARLRNERPTVYRQLQSQLDDGTFGNVLKGLMGELLQRDTPAKAIKTGHNRAIGKLLNDPSFGNRFRPSHWVLIADPSRSFVLGDNPLFAVGANDSEIGSPWLFGHAQVSNLYLPISPSQALAGIINHSVPLLSPEQIRNASVSVSQTAFFASRNTDQGQLLAPLIGRQWSPLPAEQIAKIVRDAVEGFGQ